MKFEPMVSRRRFLKAGLAASTATPCYPAFATVVFPTQMHRAILPLR
ncbi:hypothetical protein HGG75_23495 [Ochrobactrum pseudogrignonense]|nr:hypothetical protein [Brucella pseudogrignonensis]